MSGIYYVCGGCGHRLPYWALRDHRCTASQETTEDES